jgi:hypothetical protein
MTGVPKLLVALGGALCSIALLIVFMPTPADDPHGGAHLRAGALLLLIPSTVLALIGYASHRYRK